MTEVITYSLRNGEKRSDKYFEEVRAFAAEVMAAAEAPFGETVTAFQAHVQTNAVEAPRTYPEYAFELLTLGVLWRVYMQDAAHLAQIPQKMLAGLVHIRQTYRFTKPVVDAIRGVLGALYLFSKNGQAEQAALNMSQLAVLLDWLEAAGEFRETVKRLRHWQGFLAARDAASVNELLSAVLDFADWFEARSLQALGQYTPNVEVFIENKLPKYRWREDRLFCGRQRVEYHMNMVGMEVLNQAYRQQFRQAERKVIFLPPCMRAKQDGCEAVPTPYGDKCMACTPGCRVHQVTRYGEKHGFNVLMLPSTLNVLSDSKLEENDQRAGGLGVVGVACPLTIVSGGWQTQALGVPAQGLVLDYCGCPWHWHLDEGIITDINFKQLGEILEV